MKTSCKKHNWETQVIGEHKLGTVCTKCGILKTEFDNMEKNDENINLTLDIENLSKEQQESIKNASAITYDGITFVRKDIVSDWMVKFTEQKLKTGEVKKWENFKVVKKFTLFPLRIYQYTSQTTWWSWMKTSYIFKTKKYPAGASNLYDWLYSFFVGYYWKNERMSGVEEYNDYLTYKNKK